MLTKYESRSTQGWQLGTEVYQRSAARDSGSPAFLKFRLPVPFMSPGGMTLRDLRYEAWRHGFGFVDRRLDSGAGDSCDVGPLVP